jgi:hypothetical protein
MDQELIEVFARLTSQSAESIAEDLKDGGASKVEELLKGAITSKVKSARDEGVKQGESRSLTKVEKALADKFEVASYSGFDDLINKIQPAKHEPANPDSIRQSDTYREDLKLLREAKERAESDFVSFKTTVETEKLRSNLSQLGLKIIKGGKFKLPQDDKILQRRLNEFVTELLDKADFDIKDGEPIPLSKETKSRLKDNMQGDVMFKDLGLSIASTIFEVDNADPGTPPSVSTSSNVQPGQPAGKIFGIQSKADYIKRLHTMTTAEDLSAFEAEYTTKLAAGEIQ